MKKTSLTALFLIFINFIIAQKNELGNVTVAELEEKFYPTDSSAVAAFLINKGRTYFNYVEDSGFKITTDVEVKIKIYKKEGYEWANNAVAFYMGNRGKEKVDYSRAFTYNLVNGKIEKTKLKSENEFTEENNKFWSSKKIVMPNVKEGSIIEYKYSIVSPYYSTFPDWKFQKVIPVKYSEYITEIPEYFFYNLYRKGIVMPKESKETLRSSIKLKVKSDNMTIRDKNGMAEFSTINFTTAKAKYVLQNIEALKEESYVNNIDNYSMGLQHELSGIQMPDSEFEDFSTSWEKVAKSIYENDDFGSQLNKNNYFETDVNNLIKGLTSDEEKMNVIFNFVKSRMNWNSLHGYLTDLGVKKAYDEKKGNTADINLMLVSMLRFSGIKANPVLISTRSNGIPFFPTRSGFNYVIASAQINGKKVLLDATNKYSTPNILPIKVLNWNGVSIEQNGNSEFVSVMPEFKSNNSINLIASIAQNGAVNGKLREQYNDYFALKFRDRFNELSNESIAEKIENENSGLEIETYENENKNSFNEPIVEKYNFNSSNIVEIIGDKMYFSPLLHFETKINPFKQEKREYPIDFSFPVNNKYRFTVTIPEGYSIESLPASAKVNMENDYGNFNYTISSSTNQIQMLLELNINASIIPSENYQTIKDFYKLLIEKNNEKVVLKKNN